jgi:hypothetical protein
MENRERLNEYCKDWYAKRTKEEKMLYAREYRKKNADKIKTYYAREDVKQRKRETRNAWYAKNRKKMQEYGHNRRKKIEKWMQWRKDKCEICGWNLSEKILCVHHMKPEIKGTEMDNEHDTITVCRNCHMMIHTGEISKEQVYEIKNGVN